MDQFIIEFWDTDKKAIEPGFGSGAFAFASAPPVPQVGDTVVIKRESWRVHKRTYHYDRAATGLCVRVAVTCSRIGS